MTRAQSAYVTITGAVLAGLLAALVFLAPGLGPEVPADDLPNRATPSPSAETEGDLSTCEPGVPVSADGTCGLSWDDIRDQPWQTGRGE